MFNKINRVKINSIILRGLNLSVLFFTTIYCARILGPDEYGEYTFYISVFNLITIPFVAGVSTFLVREISKTNEKRERLELILHSKSVISSFFILIFFGVLFYSILYSLNIYLVLGLLYSILYGISGALSSVLRGLGKVILSFKAELVIRPLLVLLLIIFSSIIFQLSGKHILAIQVISFTLLIPILAFLLKNKIHWSQYLSQKTNQKKHRKAISFLILLSILQLSNNYSDILILKTYKENADVGIYKVISQIGSTILIGLMAINQVIQPKISVFYKSRRSEIQELIRESWIYINLFSWLLGIIMFVFAEDLLFQLFGSDYSTKEAIITLRVYITGMLINTFFGSVGTILNMTNHEHITIRGMLVGIISNLILSVTLVPKFGMLGTAISSTIALLIWNFILWLYTIKILSINTIGLLKLKK